ncbi:MAG: DUF4397 domain-containing protein [Fidelibacterota bacterium]
MTARRLGVLFVFVLLVSCVDIDSPNVSTQDYQSEVRFANLSTLGSATVQVTDINVSYGTITLGQASDYKEFDAGSRAVTVTFPDASVDTSFRIVFATDKKGTVFILGDTSGSRFANAVERYVFEVPTKADSAMVRVLNGLPAFDAVSITVAGEESQFAAADLSYGDYSSYRTVVAGDYAVSVDTSDVVVLSDTLALAANKRYTVAVYGTDTVKEFVDD